MRRDADKNLGGPLRSSLGEVEGSSEKKELRWRDGVTLSGSDIGCHFGKEKIRSEREYINKI